MLRGMLETLYLGWDQPFLSTVTALLRTRFGPFGGNTADAGADRADVTLCVPTARGKRRLRERLRGDRHPGGKMAIAEDGLGGDVAENGRTPRVVTVGELPALLHTPDRPLAGELEQTLAWARCLQFGDPERVGALVPRLPEPQALDAWLEIAGSLRILRSDLAANCQRFSDVSAQLGRLGGEEEIRRWRCLVALEEAYLEELRRVGLADPDDSWLRAAEGRTCVHRGTLVLVGTSDLSEMLRSMVASLETPVLALIAAPESAADRFDEYGIVRPECWQRADLVAPLEDHHLVAAGDVSDQAEAAADWVREFDGGSEPGDGSAPRPVTIGVTDESLVGPIEVEMGARGEATYRNLGWTAGETATGRLLGLLSQLLQRPSWESLAAFVRHADVRDRLDVDPGGDWLTQLDRCRADHFPTRLDRALPSAAAVRYPLVGIVVERVTDWLGPFFDPSPRPIAEWSGILGQWLDTLAEAGGDVAPAESREASPTGPGRAGPSEAREAARAGLGLAAAGEPPRAERTAAASAAVKHFLAAWSGLNGELDVPTGGASAISLIVDRLLGLRVLETPRAGQVPILGWLDLPLDDCPAMVVAGWNHPFLPRAVTADAFLPESVRGRLIAAENDRRYARDLHLLTLLLSSRRDIRLIVGRTSADGSPTPPSRLLAAAAATDVARRIRQLLGGPPDQGRAVRADVDRDAPEASNLPVPVLADPKIPSALSVTAFRDYLICPYRFYLRHVLRLRPLDDLSGELAANQFGDLVHMAVERYGESPDRDLADRNQIERRLVEHLHDYARDQYGTDTSVAVRLQIAQAEKRLQVVAERQAERFAAGWRIYAAEASVDERPTDRQGRPKIAAGIEVDGEFMGLRGRFDRIDHHPDTGRWAILDYKTHGHPPEKKHLRQVDGESRWIDLQLPLYRRMIPFLGIDAEPDDVELGYFNIGEKAEETRVNVATFSSGQLEAADELIRDCIRGIRAGQFRPTDDRVAFDDYEMILQVGVARRLIDRDELTSAAVGDDA